MKGTIVTVRSGHGLSGHSDFPERERRTWGRRNERRLRACNPPRGPAEL